METLEHTFPLPETEAHKLDELSEQIPSSTRAYVRDNAWTMVALSAIAGCLIGLLLPHKKKE